VNKLYCRTLIEIIEINIFYAIIHRRNGTVKSGKLA